MIYAGVQVKVFGQSVCNIHSTDKIGLEIAVQIARKTTRNLQRIAHINGLIYKQSVVRAAFVLGKSTRFIEEIASGGGTGDTQDVAPNLLVPEIHSNGGSAETAALMDHEITGSDRSQVIIMPRIPNSRVFRIPEEFKAVVVNALAQLCFQTRVPEFLFPVQRRKQRFCTLELVGVEKGIETICSESLLLVTGLKLKVSKPIRAVLCLEKAVEKVEIGVVAVPVAFLIGSGQGGVPFMTVEIDRSAGGKITEASTADLTLEMRSAFLGILTSNDVDDTAVGVWSPNAGTGSLE